MHEGAGNSETHVHEINNLPFLIRMHCSFLLGIDRIVVPVLPHEKAKEKHDFNIHLPM